jgi:hypothetical protein
MKTTALGLGLTANFLKCDGKLPACTACEKAGRTSECSSANDQFAKGKERRSVEPRPVLLLLFSCLTVSLAMLLLWNPGLRSSRGGLLMPGLAKLQLLCTMERSR